MGNWQKGRSQSANIKNQSLIKPRANTERIAVGLSVFFILINLVEMVVMYCEYKPLRNFLTKQILFPSLSNVWDFAHCYSRPKHKDYINNSSTNPLVWELELLARELILHGAEAGTSHVDPNLILKSVKHIRNINEAISRKYVHSSEEAIRSLNPLIHQQLPWIDDNYARCIRYYRLMRNAEFSCLLEREKGISTKDWFTLGLAVGGGVNNKSRISREIYSKTPGVSPDAVDVFFNLISSEVGSLRSLTSKEQSYDRRWAYTYNPLRKTPLIYAKNAPDMLYSPIPQLVMARISDGLYYDLIGKSNFSDVLGESYQNYIRDILHYSLVKSNFQITPESEYDMKKGQKNRSADWRIGDETGWVFIECKAKRMTLKGKSDGVGFDVETDLDKLAEFIVQNYKNINNAVNGYLKDFVYNGLPIFSVIATLEDWRLEIPNQKEYVKKKVAEFLEIKELPVQFIEKYPYEVLSTSQFELRCQGIELNGIASSFGEKANVPSRLLRPPFDWKSDDFLADLGINFPKKNA